MSSVDGRSQESGMRRKILKRIVTVLCFIGCMIHITIISCDYFSYGTTTKVEIEIKAMNKAPTTTFCARYIDLINQKRIQKKQGIKILKMGTPNMTEHDINYKQSSKLTVRDIFDNTPPADRLMLSCVIREKGDYRKMGRSNLKQCRKSFIVRKFYMQSFMCYNFYPTDLIGSFSITTIAHSYNFEKAIYAIYLPRILAESSAQFIMSSPEEIPHLSRSYGSYHRKDWTRNASAANDFHIQNKVTKVRLLPSPYDSRCIPNYDYSAKARCLIQSMKRRGVNRIPNTEIILQGYDFHHVLWSDEDNVTMKEMIDQCYADCLSITEHENCSYSFSETQVTMTRGADFNGRLRLRVMGPQAPNILITYHSKFTIGQFFLYALSCAGIWLGVSLVHVNPLLMAHWLNRKASKQHKISDIQRLQHSSLGDIQTTDRGFKPHTVRTVKTF